jgi:hypothetical protein
MKKTVGCASSMWLCSAVTKMPFARSALITGFTCEARSAKSPVIAALPLPVAPIAWSSAAVSRSTFWSLGEGYLSD